MFGEQIERNNQIETHILYIYTCMNMLKSFRVHSVPFRVARSLACLLKIQSAAAINTNFSLCVYNSLLFFLLFLLLIKLL